LLAGFVFKYQSRGKFFSFTTAFGKELTEQFKRLSKLSASYPASPIHRPHQHCHRQDPKRSSKANLHRHQLPKHLFKTHLSPKNFFQPSHPAQQQPNQHLLKEAQHPQFLPFQHQNPESASPLAKLHRPNPPSQKKTSSSSSTTTAEHPPASKVSESRPWYITQIVQGTYTTNKFATDR
jgi:hypothetical protein